MQKLKPCILKCLFIFAICISCEAQINNETIEQQSNNNTELEIIKDKSGKIKTYKTPIDMYTKNTWEFGIGYIGSSFNARQSLYLVANSDNIKGFGNGVDLFFNYNHYVNSRSGIYYGIGLELINISWNEPLLYVNYTASQSSSDFLYAVSLQFGGFYDVYKRRDKSLRLFGGIGVSLDFIFDGYYQKTNKHNPHNTGFFDFQNRTASFSFPLILGARYNFNEKHGLDLFIKYSGLTSWKFYNTTITFNNIPTTLDTNITRGASIGVRYVYEYR